MPYHSNFNINTVQKVSILAGGGILPLQLIQELKKQHIGCKVIAFRGFASLDVCRQADAVVHLLDLGKIKDLLGKWQSDVVALAGVVTRPNAASLLSAYSLFKNFHQVKEIISRGDDNLLRGAVSILEEWGHKVIGVHELMPQIMTPSAILSHCQPNEEDWQSIHTGFELLRTLSPYDVGQAVALSGKRTLAIEGPEGTDRMLRRVQTLQKRFFFAKTIFRGALVKAAKEGQDLRIDMPAIGPRTILRAKKAGLNGVAVNAGTTLIIEKDKTIAEANRLGLYLVGYHHPSEEKG